MAHLPKETKTNMSKTTKIAIAAAITAAVVFPGVAALAASTERVPVKPAVEQRKIEEQKKVEQKRLELKKREEAKKQELKDKQAAQRTAKQKRAEELKACRESNRKAQATFLKANKEAETARFEARRQVEKDLAAKIKASADKETRQAVLAEKKIAFQSAQDAFEKARKAAVEARKNNSKKCVVTSATTASPATTDTVK